MSVDLQAELNEVKDILTGVPEELSTPLREMVAAQLTALKPYWRALFVLAAGTHEEEPENTRAKRIHLAAALEMLNLAQNIHRHLINDRQDTDSLSSKSFVGSMILAGDYCFSRSANLAAFTDSPKVVAIFSEALGTVSEGQLRTMSKRSASASHGKISAQRVENASQTSLVSSKQDSTKHDKLADAETYNELPDLLHAGTLAAIEIARISPPSSDVVLQMAQIVAALYTQDSINQELIQQVVSEYERSKSTTEDSSQLAAVGSEHAQTSTNIVQTLGSVPPIQRPRWEFLLQKLSNLST